LLDARSVLPSSIEATFTMTRSVAALLLASSLLAGTAGAAIDVPSAQAVQTEIQASTPRDTLARRSVVALILRGVVLMQAGPRAASGNLTAAEHGRLAEFDTLRGALAKQHEATLPQTCRSGACDERYAFAHCVEAYQFSSEFYRAVVDHFFDAAEQQEIAAQAGGAGLVWSGAMLLEPNSQPLGAFATPTDDCTGALAP
jgi:hypothetical protein